MVYLNDLKERGYFKHVIYLADAFDEADEEQADQRAAWKDLEVTIRELNAEETAQYREMASTGNIPAENLAAVIVAHNIEREAGKKASAQEVADVICRSQTVYMHVINEWMTSLPLGKRSGNSSEK